MNNVHNKKTSKNYKQHAQSRGTGCCGTAVRSASEVRHTDGAHHSAAADLQGGFALVIEIATAQELSVVARVVELTKSMWNKSMSAP